MSQTASTQFQMPHVYRPKAPTIATPFRFSFRLFSIRSDFCKSIRNNCSLKAHSLASLHTALSLSFLARFRINLLLVSYSLPFHRPLQSYGPNSALCRLPVDSISLGRICCAGKCGFEKEANSVNSSVIKVGMFLISLPFGMAFGGLVTVSITVSYLVVGLGRAARDVTVRTAGRPGLSGARAIPDPPSADPPLIQSTHNPQRARFFESS